MARDENEMFLFIELYSLYDFKVNTSLKTWKFNGHGLRNISVYRFQFANGWAGSIFTNTGINLSYF